MTTLKWSTSHAVFVTEIDDEHQEIFEALSDCQKLFTSDSDALQLRAASHRLATRIAEHFAHEERLMRAARYSSFRWHKHRHDAARKRVERFLLQLERGDAKAGPDLVEYLTGWLHDHCRIADRMLGAALRNHRRCMWKMTFRVGTKPLEACKWVTIDGEPFEPPADDDAS